jgi:hypothetical protein
VRNIIFGTVGIIIGLVELIGSLTTHETARGGGTYAAAYSAGAAARLPIAVVFLVAGLWALRKGIQARNGR